jgi:hypothetical protein
MERPDLASYAAHSATSRGRRFPGICIAQKTSSQGRLTLYKFISVMRNG